LQYVASLEKASEHPLAAAILAEAKEKNVELVEVGDFQSITGKGVSGALQGKLIGIGNDALMQDLGADPEPLKARAEVSHRLFLKGAAQFLIEMLVRIGLESGSLLAQPISLNNCDHVLLRDRFNLRQR
jgi:cation transport ATPase